MAEFKLGRIRFVWKNNWATSSVYYKDDVVAYGGKAYICVTGHTSDASDFYTDLNISPAKWNLISDGQTWKGEWAVSTVYKLQDIVKYGARLYIANTNHTSAASASDGLENDIAKWDIFAEGLDWKGDWATSTRYRINDFVKYGGITYVCNTLHTSNADATVGLEADQAKWTAFNEGIDYKASWSAGTRYKKNDIVLFGAGLYLCNTYHTSGELFTTDSAKWDTFVQGFQYENEWNYNKRYQRDDVVRFGGNQYIAKQTHAGQTPDDDTDYWEVFARGFVFKGDYGSDSSAQEYRPGDVVRLNGYTYLCTATTIGNEPPNASYWERLNAGLFWRGEWADEATYKVGDVVRFGDNAYVAVSNHISEGDDYSSNQVGAQNSRPDLDTAGTYWNSLILGNEASVLTTKGDLVFYGGSGPTRLPVGEEGQVLRVSSEKIPEWTYLGNSDDVYYVSPNGTDKPFPDAGSTIDKPFKTIRYAAEAVLHGAKRKNARHLLERNRYFIQREIVEWTDYQIANNISPFTTSYSYDGAKCERDMGFLVDAFIYDMTHGGNEKSRESANKYVTEPGNFYTLGQGDETNASINYGLTVIGHVLAQTDPAVSYQTTAGDLSTAIVAQYKNIAYTAETDALANITANAKIVTDAITKGDATELPKMVRPTTLIRVATGKYQEILPIIVPAECCIMGDELRATNVAPKTIYNGANLTSRADTPFSFEALTRLEPVIGDIVRGVSVSATTGNTETQTQLWPYGNVEEEEAAEQLARIARRRVDWLIGDKLERTLQNISDFSSAQTGYARDQLLSNKQFMAEEVTAYIKDQYPNLKYSKTKCRQDVGYIIDAVAYDLTYGGNWQSVNAGEAYWSGTGQSNLNIDSSEKTATIAAYTFLKTLAGNIAQNLLINPTYQIAAQPAKVSLKDNAVNRPIITQTRGAAGASGDATTIQNRIQDIIDIIDGGSGTETITYPTISGVASALTTANTALVNATATIKSNMTTFIGNNFPNLTYDSTKCERDLGYILDAARFDFMLGTNFASIVAAYSYLRSSGVKVLGDQKEATLAAYEYARTLAIANVNSNATAIAGVNAAFEWVEDMILGGSNEGANAKQFDTDQRIPYTEHSAQQIRLNETFIVEEIHAHITETFKSGVTATTASDNSVTLQDTSWLTQWQTVKFEGTMLGNLDASTTYYVRNILSATKITLATEKGGSIVTQTDASGSASALTVKTAYTYTKADCTRDIKAYLAAFIEDILYPADYIREYTNSISMFVPGIYKTPYAARYYANAVLGCQEEDFFYMRNGTGLRLMTMQGLIGDLQAPNANGTSRPSAGAYASLDPGWGPKHEAAWISARSPYIQNCTTFGYGAIGQKIDGALHDGGNDSMVSNDFTQVISDGIGAWITNNGRAEMVSVFTYYSHIGYLAEAGGRIRGTNGNNSYGDFGSVAEGVDGDETPVTAVVDNKFQYVATPTQVNTDADKILNLEFSHAGEQYRFADFDLFGAGSNADVLVDEFRDKAVGQVRILDLNDSSGQLGGKGYLVVANTAQAGTTTQITIAATDGNGDSAYPGMLVVLTGGAGNGQFGKIQTYNSGSKVATVVRVSDGVAGWDHFNPGTTIVAPNSSTTYRIEPLVEFSAQSASSNGRSFASTTNWKDIHFAELSKEYTGVSHSSSVGDDNATFDVTKVGVKYDVQLNDAGTGYARGNTLTIPGTSLGGVSTANDVTVTVTAVNSVTGAITAIDAEGKGRQGIYIATADGGATSEYSYDGTTWTSITLPGQAPTGATAIMSGLIDDGSTFLKTSHQIIAGQSTSSNQLWRSTDGINWNQVAAPGGPYNSVPSVAYGKNTGVVIWAGSRDVIYTTDGGVTWTEEADALPSTGYTGLAFGANRWVAVKSGSTEVAFSTDGINWTTDTGASARNWGPIAYGNNRFVAISTNSAHAQYTLDGGLNWTEVALPAATDYSDIAYGQGMFVATRTGSSTYAYSNYGVVWATGTAQISSASGIDAVTFGSNNATPRFFAATAGSTAIASEILRPVKAWGRVGVANEKVFEIRMVEPGHGYASAPSITVTDNNNTFDVQTQVRLFDQTLANPTFLNRGSGYEQASAEINKNASDGFADFFQNGSNVAVRRLTKRPVAGSNVQFGDITDKIFKLVSVTSFKGSVDGDYTAFIQVSPDITVSDAPADKDDITMRIRYSQVRLTGHDFLDIGTGSFVDTNYPGTPVNVPDQTKETDDFDGGRVFFTTTDQDGNFRVGNLFNVEQATGVATLNAEAFNISGLQELTLGEVTLGGNSASISEFSTDPFFTADSDSVVPTQRAIKAYIEAQIGGGGASLNVNSVTAGSIFIGTNTITTVAGQVININAKLNFKGGVVGLPVAYNYFLR